MNSSNQHNEAFQKQQQCIYCHCQSPSVTCPQMHVYYIQATSLQPTFPLGLMPSYKLMQEVPQLYG